MKGTVYHEEDADISILEKKSITIIGYGNKARAIALNLRDSGMQIIIAPQNEEYKKRAVKDNFNIEEIPNSIKLADIIFLLTDDDFIIKNFPETIEPSLVNGKTIIFANGYSIAFQRIEIPSNLDVLLLSPRVPGVGVRENFLTKKGFFTFVNVYQDYTQNAMKTLLAMTKAIGGLKRGAIDVTPKQQAVMNLFSNQTFTYAMTQIMMYSILRLIDEGYPPEAIFVELILSGEGEFTVDKIVEVGMVKQMNFHSKTSQYGQMSRGMKFRSVAKQVEQIQRQILQEIKDGVFVQEWERMDTKIKLNILKHSFKGSRFAKVERNVRSTFQFDYHGLIETLELPSNEELVKLKLAEFQDQVNKFYGGM